MSHQNMSENNHRWDFSDLIIGGSPSVQFDFKNAHPQSDIHNQTEQLHEIYQKCVQQAFGDNSMSNDGIVGKVSTTDFSLAFTDSETGQKVRFRVSAQESVSSVYFFLRKINEKIPSLKDQGFSPALVRRLMDKERKGLILFGGEMGAGKTSAANAMIKEWLEQNGGSAITLEDPPEYLIHGRHGENGGLCVQRQVLAKDMSTEIPKLMRAGAPEIIFLGEIRSRDVAEQAMLAASNGHLVISTIHGKEIEGILNRLISMASSPSLTDEAVRSFLVESLNMVIYQKLNRKATVVDGVITGIVKTLATQDMDISNEKYEHKIKAAISDRDGIKYLKDTFSALSENRSYI